MFTSYFLRQVLLRTKLFFASLLFLFAAYLLSSQNVQQDWIVASKQAFQATYEITDRTGHIIFLSVPSYRRINSGYNIWELLAMHGFTGSSEVVAYTNFQRVNEHIDLTVDKNRIHMRGPLSVWSDIELTSGVIENKTESEVVFRNKTGRIFYLYSDGHYKRVKPPEIFIKATPNISLNE